MNIYQLFLSALTVEEYIKITTFIDVFIFGMSGAIFFLLYQLYQLLKFVFSCFSALIKRRFLKSKN